MTTFKEVPFDTLYENNLAKKAGAYGMIGGQTADIMAEDADPDTVTEELLLYIHKNKNEINCWVTFHSPNLQI